ncbi:metal-dependent hydrolase [Noviherbaspirillum sp. UKPF54]|uniref:metal-dependent hydrolase n=1 Tax=Noviherbaspirillum sp. UKPF54 TaxID=2601898 RepID=UPI0011B15AD1|nr:metal-dependent hydrolase [Noviherbaspirillum sp. UKPF54]QDZ29266.1 metal-dependent hydrolase [Noviherbaspirillum sp. UKPF54]
MDNLSHSVVGLAAGEFLHRSLFDEATPQQQRTRRRLLLFTGWAASNFPDLDLLLTPLLPAPLGYLLHHRGHTHTLLYALPQALLLWLLIRMLWPSARELLKQSVAARTGFLLMLALGFMLHLSMDFLNSYGLHPFHPFDSRWFYGDMVFIVEPVFWMAFGAPMIMLLPRRALKIGFMALLAGVPFYFAARGFLSWASYAALMSIAMATAVSQQRAGERGRRGLVLAMAVGLGFVAVQGMSSTRARENVAQALHGIDAESRLVDAAMTAFPSNPFCWAFVSVESKSANGSYRLRRGVVSIAPGIAPVAACPSSLWEESAHAHHAPGIVLTWEERGSLERLRRLKAENCFFEAWLRFARAPVVNEATVFDARYGTSTQGNFTAMALAHSGDRVCTEFIPRWDYPRADLLAAPAQAGRGH